MSAKRPVVSLTAGAEATRALLMKWEQSAKLSDDQLQTLAQISQLTTERPLPSHLLSAFLEVEQSQRTVLTTQDDLFALDLMLTSKDPFTPYTDLLTLPTTSSDLIFPEELKNQVFLDYLEEVESDLRSNHETGRRIALSLEQLNGIEEEYTQVSKTTADLYQLCEGLLSEERHLKLFGDELRASLSNFESLESLSHQFYNPTLSAEDAHFINMLKRIDDGVDYFQRHPTIRDSEIYSLKFKQMQNRALTLIKNYVVAFLRQVGQSPSVPAKMTTHAATASVAEADATNKAAATKTTPTNNPPAPVPAASLEELETQLTAKNAQFRAVAQRLKPLCEEVERRATQREYATLLNDIVNAYFQLRRTTLEPVVQGHINQLVQPPADVFKILREGCLYFVNLCENEYDHCIALFSTPIAALHSLLNGFFSNLYDHLRPTIIRAQDLQLLCSLVDILRYEIIDSCIERRPVQLAAFKPIADRIIEDVRDRLIFMVDIYIRDEIADFVPKPADLDYPAKLIAAKQSSKQYSNGETESSTQKEHSALIDQPLSFAQQAQLHAWYPTLERTLQLLAKLYVAIDTQTFDGIGQEVVITCSQTLMSASKRIESLHGKLDGYLFLVKYLVLLQENIQPFDIDFFVLERNLDFSHTRDLLRRLLAGEVSFSSVFALSSNNALFTILQSAAPRLTYMEKDLSKTIEDVLRQTMEAFIFSSTQLLVDSLLTFITQARSFLNMAPASPSPVNGTAPADKPASAARWASQPLGDPARVVQTYSDSVQKLKEHTGEIVSKINLYLGGTKHAAALGDPIKSNVLYAIEGFHALLSKEYKPEELVGLVSFSSKDAASLFEQANASDMTTKP